MSLMRMSWQRSLAAMALAAWLGPAGAGTAAEEKAAAPEKAPAASAEAHAPRESPPKPAPDVREFLHKRTQLEMTIQELTQRLGDFRDDQDAEAVLVFEKLRKAQKELREIMRHLRQFRGGMAIVGRAGSAAGGGGAGTMAPGGAGTGGAGYGMVAPGGGVLVVKTQLPPEERERLQKRAEVLRKEIDQIERVGDPAKAVPLRRELAEIDKKLTGLEVRIPKAAVMPGMPPPLDPPERERRMKLVNAAAESLRQAGLPEQADRLVREAEAIFSGQPMPGTLMMSGYPGMGSMPPGYAGASGPSGMPSGYPGMSGPGRMPGGYPGSSGPSGMASGYPGTSSGGPPAGYPGLTPGSMPPYPIASGPYGPPPDAAGRSPYGSGPDPATAEIRNQLREMQKQIEELRKQLQDLKGASPTGRSSENRR